MQKLSDGYISLSDLLLGIKKQEFGIGRPHFQRGLVWDMELKANLIESLLLDIPIGSFMLWETQNDEYGTDMCGNKKFDYLIIDGQQRLNTLWKFYKEVNTDFTNFEKEKEKYYWYINLNILSQEGTNFIQKRSKGNKVKDVDALLPLNCLSSEPLACKELYKDKLESFYAIIKNDQSLSIINNAEIFSRKINLRIINDESLQRVINIYIKINSSGKAVKNEEKAYAKFIRLNKFSEYFNLSELFSAVHPNNERKDGPTELTRMREHNFGFDVFLKVLLQYFYYYCHFNLQKDKGINYDRVEDILDGYNLLSRMDDKTETDFEFIYKETKKIILFLVDHKNGIIRNELKYDDLKYFADNGFKLIQPVIQLMILYPDSINDNTRTLYAKLILKSLLKNLPYTTSNPKDKNNVVGLISELNRTKNSFDKSVTLMEKYISLSHEQLEKKLSDTNKVTDHYIDLLYGLERFKDARDLSVYNFEDDKKKKEFIEFYNHEYLLNLDNEANKVQMPKLNYAINPSKQHIIPATFLTPKRSLSGSWHNIANITFISDAMNGLKGLKEQFMNLQIETQDNLNGHLINNDFINAYDTIKNYIKSLRSDEKFDFGNSEMDELFENYLKVRRQYILKEFLEWVRNFENTSPENYKCNNRSWLFKDLLASKIISIGYNIHENSNDSFYFTISDYKIEIIQTKIAPNDLIIKCHGTNSQIQTLYSKLKEYLGEKSIIKIPQTRPRSRRGSFTTWPSNSKITLLDYEKLIMWVISYCSSKAD